MIKYKSILFVASALWSSISFADYHHHQLNIHPASIEQPSINIRDTDTYWDTNGTQYQRNGNTTYSSDGHAVMRNGATVEQLY